MIEVINLTKRYGDKKAVDNISFKAEDGEVLGFLPFAVQPQSLGITERENPPP